MFAGLQSCRRAPSTTVALARHFREAEGLPVARIAERLGRSPATVKAYFYDPTGDKARAIKSRYIGLCRGCGAYTQPRNGKRDAHRYCKRCRQGTLLVSASGGRDPCCATGGPSSGGGCRSGR